MSPSTISTATTTTSSSSSRSPTKRILTELSTFNSSPPNPVIPSLAPTSPSNVLSLRAILSGSALPASTGYSTGRWLLSIIIPPTYPHQPPQITFVTRICHPNVKWETGEICLDVLGENWTPVLGVVGALECVARLLSEPGVDSPLGLEVAALVRAGDVVGWRGLVGYWCGEERWEGGLEEVGE